MPELPEVETIRRGLLPILRGRTLTQVGVHAKALRFPFPKAFARDLTGRRITGIDRRGKYLLIALAPENCLVIHLGMTGQFRPYAKGIPIRRAKHDHVTFHFEDGSALIFNDTRRFGYMTILSGTGWQEWQTQAPLANLGPDALSCTGDHLVSALARRRIPVRSALLNQRIISGLGNIYVCETLFRARLSALQPACSIPTADLSRLADSIREVLAEAILAGGSSIRDYVHTDGSLGYFQNDFRVYGREGSPCRECGSSVERSVVSGRSSFHCPSCQALRSSSFRKD